MPSRGAFRLSASIASSAVWISRSDLSSEIFLISTSVSLAFESLLRTSWALARSV
jgi:hypothetical protein